jgi:hypothetical protein
VTLGWVVKRRRDPRMGGHAALGAAEAHAGAARHSGHRVDYKYSLRIYALCNHHDDNDNKPVWRTWAVGALFRGVRRIHMNHVRGNVCFHILLRH